MRKKAPELRFVMKCIECGKEARPDQNIIKCSSCGALFMPDRDEEYIKRLINKSGFNHRGYFDEIRWGFRRRLYPYGSGVFMWSELILPGFPLELAVSLREGMTDMFELPDWLKEKIGMGNLYIKMEGQNPSGSFKDRGMPVAVSHARYQQEYYPELGIYGTACASTGDTSASMAQYAAYCRDKLKSVVFLPFEKISPGQLLQAMMYGAKVIAVKHKQGFDGCMNLIREFCDKFPRFVLVNSANAYRIIGQESIALEICQDFGWNAPDWISIPCGNGGNLTALLLSLKRQKEIGLIDRLPGIIVAQTKGANALVRWARSGFKIYKPGPFRDTIASAMNIQDPVSFPRIQKLIKSFEVMFYDAGEEEINRTRALFTLAGADICPQGAVALSAVLQAREDNKIKPNDLTVSISTASGLKFTESAVKYHKPVEGKEKDIYSNPYTIVSLGVEEIVSVLNL